MYDHGVAPVTAFVLAGGKSIRMGRDKAFLPWRRETLLSHALKLAGTLTQNVFIVGEARKFAGLAPVVEDVYQDRGPLGGIHAALSGSSTEWNLMLAVDLPLVAPRFLQFLATQAHETGATVTIPRAGNGWQPLCAVYRREFAAIAERSLAGGKNKIDPLFAQVKNHVVEEQELAGLGFSAEMFRNINTPEEWEEAQQAPHGHRWR